MDEESIVSHYSKDDYEDRRTKVGRSRLEYERSREIIGRYLRTEPMVILDVGGATGAYSFWLAGLGHRIHLVDLVPRQVDMAREKNVGATHKLISIQVADARSLPFAGDFADMVLVMGPLYHLTERADRLKVLQEAARVLKKGGRAICAAISRYASTLDGFCAGLFADPKFEKIADRDLAEGRHINVTGNEKYFTTAYFHKPAELRDEIRDAGLECERLLGVEGPWCVASEVNGWFDDEKRLRPLLLKYARALEEEESLLGSSFHLLAIAGKR